MNNTFEHQTVTNHGIDLELCTAGSGDPILFLHSGPGPLYDSAPFLDALSRRFKVYAPYHPGCGNLARPNAVTSIDDIAYAYLDFMKAEGLYGVPVIGGSVGGWIAAEIAIRDPKAFSCIVLISPLGLRVGGRTERPIADIWAISRADRRRLEYHQERFQSDDLSARTDETLLQLMRFEEAMVRYAWKPFLHNPKLGNWLHRINVPTLIVRGAEDKVVAKQIYDSFAELLPQAKSTVISNAGHHPHVEEPEETSRLIASFVQAA